MANQECRGGLCDAGLGQQRLSGRFTVRLFDGLVGGRNAGLRFFSGRAVAGVNIDEAVGLVGQVGLLRHQGVALALG
jgi:hypothetical protein